VNSNTQLAIYTKPVLVIKKTALDKTIDAGQQLINEINSVISDLMDYVDENDNISYQINELVKASSQYQREIINALREERGE
jgi:hypothetical protein